MDINSDDLKIFVTVIDSGTLSAAAVHLGQTTSGVSRAPVAPGRQAGHLAADAHHAGAWN